MKTCQTPLVEAFSWDVWFLVLLDWITSWRPMKKLKGKGTRKEKHLKRNGGKGQMNGKELPKRKNESSRAAPLTQGWRGLCHWRWWRAKNSGCLRRALRRNCCQTRSGQKVSMPNMERTQALVHQVFVLLQRGYIWYTPGKRLERETWRNYFFGQISHLNPADALIFQEIPIQGWPVLVIKTISENTGHLLQWICKCRGQRWTHGQMDLSWGKTLLGRVCGQSG